MQETEERFGGELRLVYGAVVLLMAGAFLFSVRGMLAPFLLYVLLLLLLVPYAGSRQHRYLAASATLVIGLWLLVTLGSLLAPFALAFILAYIVDPAADALQRRGVPRGVAVALLLLPVFGLIVSAFVFGIPALAVQLDQIIDNIPVAAQRLEGWWQGLIQRVQRMNLPFVSSDALAAQMRGLDGERIAQLVRERQDALLRGGWGAMSGVGRGIGIALTVVSYLVLTPVVLVYLLFDFDRVKERALDLVPPARRQSWVAFLSEYDTLLSRFLRGQVLAATVVGVMTWIGLLIVGFPFSGLVGTVAGVFNLVPYLGLVASIVPVIVIALFSGSFLGSLLKAGIVFGIVQLIDGSVTGPRITGGSVGLHPVWVMLALAVGSFFFGFIGLLLAMPTAVLIKLVLKRGIERYRASSLYGEPPPADAS